MDKIETISWRELTGNKFVRGLNPAMLTERGYIKQAAIRKVGEQKRNIFNVVYDREYLINAIGRNTCQPLFILGKEKTLKLVSEAWDACYPDLNEDCFQSAQVTNENYTKV